MTDGSLKSRFPALARLGQNGRSRRHIPWVQQTHATDCGAACLTMILHFLGRAQRFEEVRDRMGSSRDGVTARDILEAARQFGLRGRGIRLDLQDLDYLEPGTILHWQFKHFVVFEKTTQSAVVILDPAIGRRRVPMPEFSRSFTGVALVLEPAADFEPLAGGRSRIWHLMRQVVRHSGLFPRVLLTTGMLQLLGLALPLLTGMLVDRVIPRGDHDLLLVLAAGGVAIATFSFVCSLLRSFLLLQLRTHLDARMTLDFLDHLMCLPYSFFQLRQTGDLMMRLNSNTTIRELLTSSALSGILDGTAVAGYLLLLLLTNWRIGLLVMLLGGLRLLMFLASRRRIRELAVENVLAQARSSSYQVQMLEGIESLKSAGAEQQSVDRWSSLFVDALNVSVGMGRVTAYTDACLGTLNAASPLLVLGYGGYLVMGGHLSLGSMLALNALAVGFLTPLSSLASTALQLQRLGSYVDRVEDVFRQQPEQAGDSAKIVPPLRGTVSLQAVSFRYADSAPWAVQDIDLEVRAGECIAIVGRSGSGKSTLARLLVGLHRPAGGRILYDGHDLAALDLRSIRRQIGFVPQFPYVFSVSIRENIALRDPRMPLEQVVRAAQLAAIHDEILLMPLGYETPLVGGGASISGGQRQRIALARALVGEPPILVLDEASSSLDTVTEARVHENLRALRATQIVVAHRLSTVRDADRILVMEAGRIVEQGSHAELLKLRGAYAALVAGQLQAEAREY